MLWALSFAIDPASFTLRMNGLLMAGLTQTVPMALRSQAKM